LSNISFHAAAWTSAVCVTTPSMSKRQAEVPAGSPNMLSDLRCSQCRPRHHAGAEEPRRPMPVRRPYGDGSGGGQPGPPGVIIVAAGQYLPGQIAVNVSGPAGAEKPCPGPASPGGSALLGRARQGRQVPVLIEVELTV